MAPSCTRVLNGGEEGPDRPCGWPASRAFVVIDGSGVEAGVVFRCPHCAIARPDFPRREITLAEASVHEVMSS